MNVTPRAAGPQKLEVAAEVALDLVRQSVPMAESFRSMGFVSVLVASALFALGLPVVLL